MHRFLCVDDRRRGSSAGKEGSDRHVYGPWIAGYAPAPTFARRLVRRRAGVSRIRFQPAVEELLLMKRFQTVARRGLTLVELVVVMAIIAVLAAMVIPRLDFLKNQAENAAAAGTAA